MTKYPANYAIAPAVSGTGVRHVKLATMTIAPFPRHRRRVVAICAATALLHFVAINWVSGRIGAAERERDAGKDIVKAELRLAPPPAPAEVKPAEPAPPIEPEEETPGEPKEPASKTPEKTEPEKKEPAGKEPDTTRKGVVRGSNSSKGCENAIFRSGEVAEWSKAPLC